MMTASRKDVYYIEVVGRALDLLEVFLHEQKAQLSLKEIAQRLNQSMNTTFRLLYTLAEHGYVVKTNKQYELGSKLLDLGNAKLRNTDLIAAAGPHMEALRQRFRETVNLGVIMEGQVRYIDVKESVQRFRLSETVGGSDPLHCTALGKAHLAWLPFAEARQLLRTYGMPRITENCITSLSAMKAELERIRERGFAIDPQESMLGAFCVAAPILDRHQRPVAAISIAGPYVRFNESHAAPAGRELLAATAEISKKLSAAGVPRKGRLHELSAGAPARKARKGVAV
jgi:IclR family acetate operon transcriptional repressor